MTSSTLTTGVLMFALGLALGWHFLGDTGFAPSDRYQGTR